VVYFYYNKWRIAGGNAVKCTTPQLNYHCLVLSHASEVFWPPVLTPVTSVYRLLVRDLWRFEWLTDLNRLEIQHEPNMERGNQWGPRTNMRSHSTYALQMYRRTVYSTCVHCPCEPVRPISFVTCTTW
jgi:hypothetical protein